MIVKDEAHIIEKTLRNVCSKVPIADWIISDTGSTDGTQDIIKRVFNELNIPGKLFEDKWENHGVNRTIALKQAYENSESDYVFIFDADDSIEGTFVLPEDFGSFDAYFVTLSTAPGFYYKRPALATNKKKWYYLGVLHEFIHADDPRTFGSIEGDYYIFGGTIGNDAAKYKRDAELIKNELETNKNIPGHLRSRYLYYLAQSYKDAGMKKEAIEAYKQRILKGEQGQEVYISFFEIGNLYAQDGDPANAIFYYMQSIQADNRRVEGICRMMTIFRELGNNAVSHALYRSLDRKVFDVPRNSDYLFVHKYMYDWQIHYEDTVAAAHYGDFDSRYQFQRIYDHRDQIGNKEILKNCAQNLQIYINNVKDLQVKKDLIDLKIKFERLLSEQPSKIVTI